MSVQPEVTYEIEYSWEATTLDYLSPRWYTFEGQGVETQEAAEAAVAQKYSDRGEGDEPIAYRWRKVVAERPETGYVDQGLEADFAANRQYWADRARAERDKERFTPRPGKTVRVFKGRKVPVGTEGYVFWYGEGSYGGYRVGFKDASGDTHWTAASNVEVIEEEVAAA